MTIKYPKEKMIHFLMEKIKHEQRITIYWKILYASEMGWKTLKFTIDALKYYLENLELTELHEYFKSYLFEENFKCVHFHETTGNYTVEEK